MRNRIILFLIVSVLVFEACQQKLPPHIENGKNAVMMPDYTSISIPVNIAPLNFSVNEAAEKYLVRFYNDKNVDFSIRSINGRIKIPVNLWRRLLNTSVSHEYYIDIYIQNSQQWVKFNTVSNKVLPDSIDKYLVYRLIEPGFELWNKMGIYQRDMENFREKPIMHNVMSDGNCMNCHSFNNNNSNTMMFHMRGPNKGTIIFKDDSLFKISTKTDKTISEGVYPAWHPSGNYLAYSVNNIIQFFHSKANLKVEVLDTLSDIILYDIKNNHVTSCSSLSDPEHLETFPNWSPDGRSLYYCSAQKLKTVNSDQIRYDVLKIEFNPDNATFGSIDTVLHLSDKGQSASFPKISPDGKYILFCVSRHGNFSIWHNESDLYLLDLNNGIITRPEINSDKSESYHSWSSTGRWVVFSSRRDDGLYTRPYFAYFDSSGKFHKPFELPQKDPDFYFDFMKSYNIPEMVTTKVLLTPRMLRDVTITMPLKSTFSQPEKE